jgi:SAM-dependent methyltransferase
MSTPGPIPPQDFRQWNRTKWEHKNRQCYEKAGQNRFPWYYKGLDADLDLVLIREKIPPGAAICDLGTCSGSQAIGLAIQGYDVVGTDVSQTALDQAKAAAERYRGLKLRFVLDDILDSALPPESFDVVFDRGCFHSLFGFTPAESYEEAILRLLRPGGLLVLKMMSDTEKRFRAVDTLNGQTREMPHHFRREELDGLFSPRFECLEIRESRFQSSIVAPDPIAWLMVLRKRK